MSQFSDYIIYTGEYGDKDIENIDENHPLFIQSFCIFDKQHYSNVVSSLFQQLKFQYLGHDSFSLAAEGLQADNKILKPLRGANKQRQFQASLKKVIEESNFVLITCVVDKRNIKPKGKSSDVFEHALAFGLDHCHRFLQERDQTQGLTHIVFPDRSSDGKQSLQLQFRHLCEQQGGETLPFESIASDAPVGIQFASFMASPIKQHFTHSDKPNPLFETLEQKFYCKGGRKKVGKGYDGWGLKNF